jgi:hypothetical protein
MGGMLTSDKIRLERLTDLCEIHLASVYLWLTTSTRSARMWTRRRGSRTATMQECLGAGISGDQNNAR